MQTNTSRTVACHNRRTIRVPTALVQSRTGSSLVSNRQLKVPGKVEEVQIALVVDSGKEGRIRRMPFNIVHVVL